MTSLPNFNHNQAGGRKYLDKAHFIRNRCFSDGITRTRWMWPLWTKISTNMTSLATASGWISNIPMEKGGSLVKKNVLLVCSTSFEYPKVLKIRANSIFADEFYANLKSARSAIKSSNWTENKIIQGRST